MQNRKSVFALFILVMALFVGLSVFAHAQQAGKGAGPAGKEWKEVNSFSGIGVVVSTDTTAGTMVATVDRGSRLVKELYGTNATFQVDSKVQVKGFGMGKGGMIGHGKGKGGHPGGGGKGGPGGGGGGGKGTMTFADVQAGDSIHFSGTYDETSKQFTVKRIMVWLH